MPQPHQNSSSSAARGAFSTIATTGILVGVIDGLAALALTLAYHHPPLSGFQYIASALLGPEAFSNGIASALFGLLCHFFIALTWSAMIFMAHPRISKVIRGKVAKSILYGLVIWSIMNLVILPITLVAQGPLTLTRILTGIAILIVAAGAPIAWSFDRYFLRTTR
jgi:hypothetical protein